jgi:hypothetical protein
MRDASLVDEPRMVGGLAVAPLRTDLLVSECVHCHMFPCLCLRAVPCVCGGVIEARGTDRAEAIREHQRTVRHDRWREAVGIE